MIRFFQWLVRQDRLLAAMGPLFGHFRPFSPEHRRDPYATWRAVREAGPIYRSRVFGTYLVTGYDDVLHMLRSPDFSSDRSDVPFVRLMARMAKGQPDFKGMIERNLLAIDGAEHRRLRGLVSKAFTPRRVAALRPRLEQTVDEILDRAGEKEAIEIVRDLAHPFPVIAIAELLGVPPEDRDRFRAWSSQLVQLLDPFQGSGGAAPMSRATHEIFEYFRPLLRDRREHPRDDLLSAMLAAAEEEGEALDEIDLLSLASLVLTAGHETTSNLIANAVLCLLRFPDERKRLQDDLSLLPSAIDEVLRFESPIQFTDRVTTRDCDFAGQALRKNTIVGAVLAAANRDPARFPEPERFDITRANNNHLAFGQGNHFCLGSQLAKLETEIALGALLRRFPDFRGAPEPPAWRRSMIIRGPESLPLTLV